MPISNTSPDGVKMIGDFINSWIDTEEADSKLLRKAIVPVKSMRNPSVLNAIQQFESWLGQQCDGGEQQKS